MMIFLSDPDECVSSTLNDCDENAICKNEKLSFSCTCKESFVDKGVLPGRLCVKQSQDDRQLEERVEQVESDKLEKDVYEKDKIESKEITQDLTAISITALVVTCLLFLAMLIVIFWSRKKFNKQTFNYAYA